MRSILTSRATLFAAALALPTTLLHAGEPIVVLRDQPIIDQWVYPFASTPGSSPFASVFSSKLPEGFTTLFDNRDGQALVAFDVLGAAPEGTQLLSARVVMRTNTDNTFQFDPTPDSYTTWLLPSDEGYEPDSDPGRALELFGVGFRNGLGPMSFSEAIPYSFVGPFGQHIRNAHPIAFNSPRVDLDLSNNVQLAFDPVAFAIGDIPGLDPGDSVPAGSDVVFDLDLDDPQVRGYVEASLAQGRLFLVVASLFDAEQQGSGTFPSFFTKENALVVAGIESCGRLELVLEQETALVGDLDGDGAVNGADLGQLLSAWGACPGCPEDLDGDGVVDGSDLGTLLTNWTG